MLSPDAVPLPTPVADNSRGLPSDGTGFQSLPNAVVALLPTPVAKEPGGTPEQYRARWQKSDGRDSTFLPLSMTVQLLPTPRATDGTKGGPNQRGSSGDLMLPSAVNLLPTPTTEPLTGNGHARHLGAEVLPDRWGEYGPAIRRCEELTRPAPEPTKLNAKGNPKLSDEFDEWLMMLPAGWITDVPGITWNEVLKACGNGVVPPQVAAALRWLRAMSEVAA